MTTDLSLERAAATGGCLALREIVQPSADEAVPTARVAYAWAKKAAVMAELRRIPRNGLHERQRYPYLRGDDLLDAVRPLLAAHGLVPTFVVSKVEQRDLKGKGWEKDDKGRSTPTETTQHLTRVSLSCAFVDTDTGQRIDEGTWYAETHDGDKAIRAATSMAVAAFLGTSLLVSAGDAPGDQGDPEAPDEDAGDLPPRDRPRRQASSRPARSREAADLLSEIWAAKAKKNIPMAELEKAAKDLGHTGMLKDCADVKVLRVLAEICAHHGESAGA